MKTSNYSEFRKGLLTEEERAEVDRQVAVDLEEIDLRNVCTVSGIAYSEAAETLKALKSSAHPAGEQIDPHTSSLRRLVEALGGELEIVARFGHRTVRLR